MYFLVSFVVIVVVVVVVSFFLLQFVWFILLYWLSCIHFTSFLRFFSLDHWFRFQRGNFKDLLSLHLSSPSLMISCLFYCLLNILSVSFSIVALVVSRLFVFSFSFFSLISHVAFWIVFFFFFWSLVHVIILDWIRISLLFWEISSIRMFISLMRFDYLQFLLVSAGWSRFPLNFWVRSSFLQLVKDVKRIR